MSRSENEDDPAVSSGDDWVEEEKKKDSRRLSSRLSKKPKLSFRDDEEEEAAEEDEEEEPSSEEESEEEVKKSRKRNGATKKKKNSVQNSDESESSNRETGQIENRPEYSSGSFVINNKEAHKYDAANPPHIWRIDGKALLQKFEPFHDDGVLKYRNTSIYTGWSSMDSDRYAPIKDVNVLLNTNHKLILTFNADQLNDIAADSE